MKTSSNNNNNESINGMSQVINILTGETKKIRCHYLSKRTDKPVSRVLTLERLNHPALTAAGVTAWAERFNDGVNSFDWLRVSIQLTDKNCYTPNCANVELPDVENYGNLDYYKNQEGAMRVSMNNVDKFFQSIADKPAKMMTGEDWPNMAVIAAYRAAGRDEEADTLTTARDIYNARREVKNEAWRKEWEEIRRKEQEKQNSFAEGMRVKVPAASLERNRDKEAFVITRIRRKAAENGGNASLTVKSELTGMERDINGSDVSEVLPAFFDEQSGRSTFGRLFPKGLKKAERQPASDTKEAEGVKAGTEVWTTIELHEEYGKRGKVVRRFFADHGVWCLDIEFEDGTRKDYAEEYVTTEKPWAVVGAKCRHKYLNRDVVLTITAVGQYYGIMAESEDGKVKRCGLVRDFEPVEDIREAEGVKAAIKREQNDACISSAERERTRLEIKIGDKVRHNLTGDRVATVTGIRRVQGYKWQGEITVYRLDFGQSVKGPFDMELNGGEFLREAFTPCEASEIKPKAAFQIGDRVERKSDGERGTVDGYDVTGGKLTYIVKYDRTQRRQSDGFEYLSEELNGDELQAA